MASELRTRLIIGPLLLAFIGAVYAIDVTTAAGGRLSAGLLGLLALAGVAEFDGLLRRSNRTAAGAPLLAFTAALGVSALALDDWHRLDRLLLPLTLGTAALLFAVALRALAAARMKQGLEAQAAAVLGFVWIAWPMFLAQGLALHHLPSVLCVVLVCKGGDIGAYLVGISWGRRKLIPHVSPGKTVEGAVGSLLASTAIAGGLRPWLAPPGTAIALTGALGIGIMLNVTAQTGDLVESLLKRSCGAKDSSALLPAHGGVLDLIDSLLFSFPAYFLLLVSLG